jgi:hypothetical protein
VVYPAHGEQSWIWSHAEPVLWFALGTAAVVTASIVWKSRLSP